MSQPIKLLLLEVSRCHSRLAGHPTLSCCTSSAPTFSAAGWAPLGWGGSPGHCLPQHPHACWHKHKHGKVPGRRLGQAFHIAFMQHLCRCSWCAWTPCSQLSCCAQIPDTENTLKAFAISLPPAAPSTGIYETVVLHIYIWLQACMEATSPLLLY